MKKDKYTLKIVRVSLLSISVIVLLIAVIIKFSRNVWFSDKNIVNPVKMREWSLLYINDISWSPDNEHFALSGIDSEDGNVNNLYVYGVNSGEPIWAVTTIGGGPSDFQSDGQAIAVPYYAGIEYFDSNTGEKMQQIDQNVKLGGICVATNEIEFTLDGTKVVSLNTNWDRVNTTIYFWNNITQECIGMPIEESGNAFDFEISSKEQMLAIGLPNVFSAERGQVEPQVHIWDMDSRELICNLEGVPPIALSQDGIVLASGSITDKGRVDLWDAKNCLFLSSLTRQEIISPFSMDFSPDGSLLAVGNSDNFEIWDVASRKLLFVSEGLPNNVTTLLFSPNGKYLLTKTDRKSTKSKAIITLWSIEN